MNKQFRFFSLLSLLLLLLFSSCKQQKTLESRSDIELNDSTIIVFAQNIADGIISGRADALNSVINHENIRQLVCENSIVYSGFDVEGGRAYFESCLHIGEPMVTAVNNGGDFAFTRHYKDKNIHHIVFRSYDNFVVNFYDFTVDTVGGALHIQDGFIYNAGCLLSQSVQGSMLYNLMLQTNPESDVQWLLKSEELTRNKQAAQSIALLNEHRDALKEYPAFYQLYIANLYQHDKKKFISNLDLLKDHVDERTLLLHKLLYNINEGKVDACEENVNKLIPHTGDDPIFLFLYGYANLSAQKNQEALNCFLTVEQSMPLIWDLWQSELQCYKRLNDPIGFAQCLQKGKSAYGLSEEELKTYDSFTK